MAHCCSQCNFTAQFESALMMHRQLHHESEPVIGFPETSPPKLLTEKSNTMPATSTMPSSFSERKETVIKLGTRTSSATKLFEKLRSRIRSRSRTLFSHPEEAHDGTLMHDLSCASDCTSKELNLDILRSSVTGTSPRAKETFGCHLCTFDADRITALDRHLLNHHKIGLDNLLKLVMAKTKDGLTDDSVNPAIFGLRQTYYKPVDEIIEEGELVIETVTPKIKILKHAYTNTDTQWSDIPDLKDNCTKITRELERLMRYPTEKCDNEDLLTKMQTLSECMCKFVDSTNTLKKVLTKEYESRLGMRGRVSAAEPFFELGLGDQTPRDWEKAHSERMERARHKYQENARSGKPKLSSESFYF